MARLIVAEGGVKRALSLVLDEVTVGQGPQAQVRLKDPAVEPAHCRIVKSGDTFILTPSAAPMLLNGRPVSHPEVLKHGDQMRIGEAILAFDAQVPAPAAAPAPPPEPEPARLRAAPASAREPRGRRESGRRAEPSNLGPMLGWGALVLVVLSGLGSVLNMASRGLTAEQKLAQAKTLIQTKRVDDAMVLLRDIDRSAGKSYDEAQTLLRKHMRTREARQERLQPPDPLSVFNATVLPYYETHLKGEKERDGLERARVQYFLDWRAKPFLTRFPDSDRAPTIKRMQERYQALIPADRSFPETFEDVSVVVEGERELSHYGEAYRVLTEWITARGGGGADAEEAKKLADRCVADARHLLDKEKERAWRYAEDQYFETAKRTLQDVAENVRGIPAVVSEVNAELNRIVTSEQELQPAR